jgi:hypothetical protein
VLATILVPMYKMFNIDWALELYDEDTTKNEVADVHVQLYIMVYVDQNSYKREVNHSQMARGPSLVGLYAWAECMPSVRLGMEHGACLSSVILGKQAPHVNNWFLRPVVCRALPHSAYAAPLLDGRIRLTIC